MAASLAALRFQKPLWKPVSRLSGTEIQTRLKVADLIQTDLAEVLRVTETTIYRQCTGKAPLASFLLADRSVGGAIRTHSDHDSVVVRSVDPGGDEVVLIAEQLDHRAGGKVWNVGATDLNACGRPRFAHPASLALIGADAPSRRVVGRGLDGMTTPRRW